MERPHVVVLAVLLLLWFAFTVVVGRFTPTDELAFKAAGYEWAFHGRFAAPELAGLLNLKPPVEQVWFAHLPVYPFVFGVFTRAVGLGPHLNAAFDALIEIAIALLTFSIARREGAGEWASVIAACAVLPFVNPGRADELSIAFGMAGLLAAHDGRRLLTGVLFGLCGATSSVAAVILGIDLLFIAKPRFIAVAFAASIVTAMFCFAPVLITHPGAWHQFITHAEGQSYYSLTWALRFAWRYGSRFLLLAAMAVMLFAFGERRLFASLVIATAVLFVATPEKYYYFWFIGPLILSRAAIALPRHRVAWFPAAVLYAAALLVPLHDAAIRLTLPPDQRLGPNVAAIERTIPSGADVAATEFWTSIANRYRYHSLTFSPRALHDSDYVILTGNGSGTPGTPQMLPPAQNEELHARFVPILDRLNHHRSEILGAPLSHSGWGYGVMIWKRRGR